MRFISDDFASKDIRKIDSVYLKSYTQNWVDSKHPKKKVFLAYKGILNMIFRYAKAEGIISDNPVMSLNNKAYLKSCDTTKPKPEEKILAPEEIDRIREEVRRRMQMKQYGRYYVQGKLSPMVLSQPADLLFAYTEIGRRLTQRQSILLTYRYIHISRLFSNLYCRMFNPSDNCVARRGLFRYPLLTYRSRKGVSIIENAAHLGLPVPDKLKAVLEQLHDRAEKGGDE